MRLYLSIAAALLFAASAAGAAEKAPANAVIGNLPAITVLPVERARIADRISASGLISHFEQVSVAPQIEGQAIETLEVEVGEAVNKGQVLARLSRSALELKKSQLAAQRAGAVASIAQAQAQEVEAKAAAEQAERARVRAATLAERGMTAKAAAEQADTSAEAANARVSAAAQARNAAAAQLELVDAQIADVELQLSRTEIKAPVAGVIVQRNANIGAIAGAAGQPMFMILRDGLLEMHADVAEQDLLRVAVGQRAQIRVPGRAETIAGTVRLIEPTVNATTRLGRVRIAIDNSSQVKWGMFADAVILAAEREALVVPVSAVESSPSGYMALKVVDGVVKEATIVRGIFDRDKVEIVSGLGQGDLVVAKAGAFVRDGDRVNPVRVANPAATN
jgi:HlyD family secretion protein